MKLSIDVTVTPYDSDVPFPEAEHYPEFVAERLTEMFPGYEVTVDTGLANGVRVPDGSQDVDYIRALVGTELWEEFCAEGYKQFSPS